MSRTATSTVPPPSISIDAISLARALHALSAKLLTPTPSPELLHSSLERTKTGANLEYARTLLMRLEHTASKERIQRRKQAQLGKLAQQRDVVKQLTERLYKLGREDDGQQRGVVYGGRQEQQPDHMILQLIGEDKKPAIEVQEVESEQTLKPLPDNIATMPSSALPPSASIGSHLRARKQLLGSHAAATSTGFSPSSKPDLSTPSDKQTQAQLEAADSTHAQLTSSLLSIASALSASAKQFQDDLQADSEALKRTEGALGKNVDGLDAATSRMGVLSKMSEGRWGWGRMLLFAMIAGLWLLALGIVFVGPKIRF